MRWDDLFNDLEGQLETELTAEEADLQAEEERLRLARLGLRDRLLSLHHAERNAAVDGEGTGDRALRLVLRDGSQVSVTPSTFGRDWFAGELVSNAARPSQCVVPLAGIASVVFSRAQVYRSLGVTGDRAGASGAGGIGDATSGALASPDNDRSLSARLGLGFVLRDLCRRRSPLELRLATGTVHGTLDRVGRDHCDVAVHDAGGVRREALVTEFRLVPFSELLLVRL